MAYLYEVSAGGAMELPAWPSSARERQRLTQELLACVVPVLRDVSSMAADQAPPRLGPEALLDAFLATYPHRPLAHNKGGSGLNDSLWLYLIAATLAPRLIVESGTWRGHSAWLFRRACPEAEIHSFDVERPVAGRYEEPGVFFHLRDWTEMPLSAPSEGVGLVFFDDHVSHAQRLQEAAARGFPLALLDDNFPGHQLHATGAPPVPTLAMLCDTALPPGGEICWQRNGKLYVYRDTLERRQETQRLVETQITVPDLAPITRHPPGSGLTLVRLRSFEGG